MPPKAAEACEGHFELIFVDIASAVELGGGSFFFLEVATPIWVPC